MNLLEAAKAALSALGDSIDEVRDSYAKDWRHGIPTRAAQLESMRCEVELHATAITELRAAIEAEESAEPFRYGTK